MLVFWLYYDSFSCTLMVLYASLCVCYNCVQLWLKSLVSCQNLISGEPQKYKWWKTISHLFIVHNLLALFLGNSLILIQQKLLLIYSHQVLLRLRVHKEKASKTKLNFRESHIGWELNPFQTSYLLFPPTTIFPFIFIHFILKWQENLHG